MPNNIQSVLLQYLAMFEKVQNSYKSARVRLIEKWSHYFLRTAILEIKMK